MPCRICSDFDNPVRAEIEDSRSKMSGSIMNVQRFFLLTATRAPAGARSNPRAGSIAPSRAGA
jgi:hypothetical protein